MVKKKNSFSAQNDELLFRKFTSSNFDNEREREREKRKNHVFTFSQLLKKKNALFFTLYYTLMRTKMKEKNEFSRHIISIINTLII